MRRTIFIAAATLLLAACATPPTAPKNLSAEELLAAEPLTGGADIPAMDNVDILTLDPETKTFLEEHVNEHHASQRKVRDLIRAIADVNNGLKYDDTTRTAEETFRAQAGNCLSFTNMFVAMGREVGLRVSYQEVDVPRD